MVSGILAPIPTPFTADESVDFEALCANTDRWMTTPLSGLLVLGSNGEAPYIDEDEAEQIVRAMRPHVRRDRVLMVGTGRESTRATLAACERAAAAGADCVLVRTPSFFKSQLSEAALIGHFTAVAARSPVPVFVYNFLGLTGVNLSVSQMVTLAGHPNIVGVKESGGDLSLIADFVTRTPDHFTVVVGSAPTLYPSLCAGASGAILAMACAVPEVCVRLFEAVAAGRHDEALALQRRITPLARAVTSQYGVAGLKAALDLTGYRGGLPRRPLLPLSAAAREEIRGHLERLSSPAGALAPVSS
jgi:4-hydroxy-2-oxoglutarate aldolase